MDPETTVKNVRHFTTPEVRAVDVAERTITHLVSTASVDRMGDIIDGLGWELENFRVNPVVVADHDYSVRSIIGVSVAQRKSAEGLIATTRFDDQGLGAEAFRLATADPPMLRAWSVGFRSLARHGMQAGSEAGCEACIAALKGNRREPGLHFTKQELLEYSAVAVPANPETVTEAIRRGLVTERGARILFTSDGAAPGDPARAGANAAVRKGVDATRRIDALLDAQRRLRRMHSGTRMTALVAERAFRD